MHLYAEATHIYKPGNKDEVRLVYRVRGGGESNRHQKSFSIGKYGTKECWRMATESKNFINTTHRLPHDFLDPWASLKQFSSHSITSNSEKNENFFSKSMSLKLNTFYKLPFEDSTSKDIIKDKYKLLNVQKRNYTNNNFKNQDTLICKNKSNSDAFDNSFSTLKNIEQKNHKNDKKTNNSDSQRYSINLTKGQNIDSIQVDLNRKENKNNSKSSRNTKLQFNNYNDAQEANQSQCILNPHPVINESKKDQVLFMHLKKKRGRPPKWLRRFSPTELNQIFKTKKDAKFRIEKTSTKESSEKNQESRSKFVLPKLQDYNELESDEILNSKMFKIYSRKTNALLASAHLDWVEAKASFEKFCINTDDLFN